MIERHAEHCQHKQTLFLQVADFEEASKQEWAWRSWSRLHMIRNEELEGLEFEVYHIHETVPGGCRSLLVARMPMVVKQSVESANLMRGGQLSLLLYGDHLMQKPIPGYHHPQVLTQTLLGLCRRCFRSPDSLESKDQVLQSQGN